MKEIRDMGEMMASDSNSGAIKVYRPRAWILSVMLAGILTLCTLLVIWLALFKVATSNDWLTPVFGVAFLIVVNIAYILSILPVRIVISPKQFEYYGVGYRVRTKWEDLLRVEHTPPIFGWRYHPINSDRLFLQRSFVSGPSWIRALTKFTGQSQITEIGHFDPWWRKSSLGDEIRRYAPHLNI